VKDVFLNIQLFLLICYKVTDLVSLKFSSFFFLNSNALMVYYSSLKKFSNVFYFREAMRICKCDDSLSLESVCRIYYCKLIKQLLGMLSCLQCSPTLYKGY
jgi:hypothetical protein